MSQPKTITPADFATLTEIAFQAQDHWAKLRELEQFAYSITREEDNNGFTSDLIWHGTVSVEGILGQMGITVEGTKP